MITFDHDQRRRESCFCGGWNVGAEEGLPSVSHIVIARRMELIRPMQLGEVINVTTA